MAKADWHHLYKTARWQRLRKQQLAKEPFCEKCERQGRTEAATVVDHKAPHKGNENLFFDPRNLQSMCKPHHDSSKKREENRGVVLGCDENGMPLDPDHHWNRPGR